jgi:transcriptional regulator with AAA-type ATPase domain
LEDRRKIMEEMICEIKKDKMDIANLIEFNDKEEANAIINYNELLEAVKNSDLTKSQKERIESEVYEIIGDELNHQERLKMLYSLITGIKENKD